MVAEVNKGDKMTITKEQKIDMNLEKIALYSDYVESISRILQEIMNNGNENFKTSDILNLISLLTMYANVLHFRIIAMKRCWEFD